MSQRGLQLGKDARLSHRPLKSRSERLGVEVHRGHVIDALKDVYDPCCRDRGLSIVDMGLVETVEVDGSRVRIGLVLTSGWCPFVASMSTAIPERLTRIDGIDDVEVEVLWDPVWTMDRLSPKAREALVMPLDALVPYRERRLVGRPVTLPGSRAAGNQGSGRSSGE